MKLTKKEKTTDMTIGSPMKLLIFFAIPVILGNIFQQAYILVDTAIIGRVLGLEALSAMGNAAWPQWMIVGSITSLTQGFSILMARHFGSKNMKQLHESVISSVILEVFFAIALIIVFYLTIEVLLKLIKVPEGPIMTMALDYMHILIWAIPVFMAYNGIASILRALGDSKTPLAAIAIASILNIGLDLLFIVVLNMDIRGVALGTALSQCFAAIFCFVVLMKMKVFHFTKQQWKFRFNELKTLVIFGLPMALNVYIASIGGLYLQSAANQYSISFIAGVATGNQLFYLLEMIGSSLSAALLVYTGQNHGAGQYKRIKTGAKDGVIISVAAWVFISLIVILLGEHIISMFIKNSTSSSTQAISYGTDFLIIMGLFTIFLNISYALRAILQGLGNTIIPLFSTLLGMITRIIGSNILPKFTGETGIFYTEVCSWITGAILIFIFYMVKQNSLKKHIEQT